MGISAVHTLNRFLVEHPGIEGPLATYEKIAEVLFLGVLLVVIVLARGAGGLSWRRACVAAGLSAGVALAVGKVLSVIVNEQRPFVSHPALVHLFFAHAPDPGFPSDHATASFAIAVAIMLRSRLWGSIVLLAAAILSVGRVMLGFHYPIDIIAGAVIGTAAALVLWLPPIRRLVDRISDFAGGIWDGLVDRLLGRRRVGAST